MDATLTKAFLKGFSLVLHNMQVIIGKGYEVLKISFSYPLLLKVGNQFSPSPSHLPTESVFIIHSCNSLLSSVHTLLVNILRCVRLYIKRK